MNGHEWRNPSNADPQHACIFPLLTSRDCSASAAATGCDCTTAAESAGNPLCQNTSGVYSTIQRFGKAYPVGA